NKEWQGFAAIMAAAYAKDLLHQIPPSKVEAEKPISEILSSRCGKTILSTTILDHLLQIDTHTTLAFFFDFNDARKQKLEDLLCSLAVQLYHTGNEAARRLDSLFTSHDDGRRQPDTIALSAYIDTMIRITGKVFVIIDALDECTTREELLHWMRGLVSSNAQILVTGRPEAEFQGEIPRSFDERNCVLLDKKAVNADIRSYVESTLEQKPDFVDKKLSLSILEEIRDKIGDGADGMRGAIRLLQFLVHTKRPLNVLEAIEVIATQVDQESRGFDVDGRLCQERDVLRYCPSLVIIAEVTTYAGTVNELRLAHFSVKEYLLEQAEFDLENASIVITRTCLTYLSDVKSKCSTIRSDFPMARYAAESWMDYAVLAETSEDILRSTVSFLRDETTFQRWCRLYQADREWDNEPGPPRASRLYYACLGGLSWAARDLTTEGADVNSQGGGYGNALQAASFKGNPEVVQLLLDKGADVNAQGGEYGNALQAASLEGNLEVVQLLLDKGADVNAQGGEFGNALQAASFNGNLEVVQLLLYEGADVNAQGGVYGNALQAASTKGNLEVVQLLLDKGADVNTQGGVCDTALQAASFKGNPEVVQLLLDGGADVNAEGGEYGNALQAASFNGNPEIVQLLLDKGADVNVQGGHFGNALQAALSNGKLEVVQLLLDKGADVNAQGGHYGNALQAASLRGYLEIVQLLLDKGADVNVQGGEYGNALYAASYKGNLEVVQLLLDKGANINAQGGLYGNALQAALSNGKLEVMQLLLEKGADVNAQGGRYGNALQAASCRGHLEIVQTLLDKGADVNARGGVYGNALQAASYWGHLEVMQLLLDKGADVDAQTLQAASRRSNPEIVQLLNLNGAKVMSRKRSSSTNLRERMKLPRL
ncbi:Pfs, NACHT and Ankyrin domain protein, partial [Fusarium austroafricanum]